MSSVQINELVGRYIIITLNIRNIIIFHVVITRRTPGRLCPDVHRNVELRLRGIQQGGGEENRSPE